MLACRLCDWHLLCTAQHSITPLGIPQPSCSASPAALWVVQLELGEGWLSGEAHFGPKPRCGYVLLCTAAGQKTDWEAWLSTSAPETVPSARDPVGQGRVGWGGRLSCLTKNNVIRSRRQRVCCVFMCGHRKFRETTFLLIWTGEGGKKMHVIQSGLSFSLHLFFTCFFFKKMHKQNAIKLCKAKHILLNGVK